MPNRVSSIYHRVAKLGSRYFAVHARPEKALAGQSRLWQAIEGFGGKTRALSVRKQRRLWSAAGMRGPVSVKGVTWWYTVQNLSTEFYLTRPNVWVEPISIFRCRLPYIRI